MTIFSTIYFAFFFGANRFESPTRSIQISAGQDIFIKSGAGGLDASCLNDIRLHSEAGSVNIIILFLKMLNC